MPKDQIEVIVQMEGGVIQGVKTDAPDGAIRVRLLDYDELPEMDAAATKEFKQLETDFARLPREVPME